MLVVTVDFVYMYVIRITVLTTVKTVVNPVFYIHSTCILIPKRASRSLIFILVSLLAFP